MKIKIAYCIGFILLLASCGTSRNLVYFSDLQEQSVHFEKIINKVKPEIQAGDLISVTVTSLNPESNALFNTGGLPTAGVASGGTTTNSSSQAGYLVNENGYIDFPVVGSVKLTGLTAEEARVKMKEVLSPYLKDPIVNVRFLNFRVTVIGEVNRPSTLSIPTGEVNVLEALGMAGDMTVYGRRENVLVIREKDGIRSMTRLNLNNKEVFGTPYFHLQQNDIVYVEPDKAKALQASTNNYYLPFIVTGVSVLSIILSRVL